MKLLISSIFVALFALSVSSFILEDDVLRDFASKGKSDLLIQFEIMERPSQSLLKTMTRSERRVLVGTSLMKFAERSQAEIREFVTSQGFSAQTFWIQNVLYVKSATPDLVEQLRQFDSIVEIMADKDVAWVNEPMIHKVEDEGVAALHTRKAEYGIVIIDAAGAWNVTQGEGVTIANIDTGVRYTHVAVVNQYRGNNAGTFNHDYNWLDPRGQKVPFDNNGHGTHTMGTIVGSEASGVGVAPGAKWIAAKGCASSSCSQADLIASFQYVLCPTKQDGTSPDCTKGADVVSNSWGGGRGSSTYKTYIQACIDAGMVVLFSQGNSGSSCSTANSPGDLSIVIGVGSTNSQDRLSSFSSRGPGIGTNDFPLQKPDISAPGEAVRSAYYTSDTAYATLSGTSMACPHAAGVVGLMVSHHPDWDVDTVRSILTETCDQDLGTPNGGQTTCSGKPYNTYPNYHYGYGRINAARAVHHSK